LAMPFRLRCGGVGAALRPHVLPVASLERKHIAA
jgi:hypothetical protein